MVNSSANDFKQLFRDAVEPLVGRKLSRDDGCGAGEIDVCEKRLKHRLPTALRAYYAVAGKLPLNVEHNRLYPPTRLKVVSGKLVFMEENQNVVFWGVDFDGSADPKVFQANNEKTIEWYEFEPKFSEFMVKMLRWVRGTDC